jgi:glycosyl transferase family 2
MVEKSMNGRSAADAAVMSRYLDRRAIASPWRIEGGTCSGFAGAVVIPALAESPELFSTLETLAANPPAVLERFLVLVVVNHREDAADRDREDNRSTLVRLAESVSRSPLQLAWVNAVSPGLELPVKGGGVGLARKIGLDLALSRLEYGAAEPLLVCLDADTRVQPDYLPAIVAHFRDTDCGGAVIPFCHREGATPAEEEAIRRYELFLRAYVLGLQLAGSPYAFHTVGSAMACTATAYARMGGMNSRAAGEDFYFLQHLKKTTGVAELRGTVVHPSPRSSHRVPFGTGRTMSRAQEDGVEAIAFYRPDCFSILAEWLALVGRSLGVSGEELERSAAAISPELSEYLRQCGFTDVWTGLRRNNPSPRGLAAAFHGWFDALKTMKLIHHLSDTLYPRCAPDEALPGLLRRAGLSGRGDARSWLDLLRERQNGTVPAPYG